MFSFSNKIILGIESCTNTLSCCICKDGSVIEESFFQIENNSSYYLIAEIDRILKHSGYSKDSLSCICMTVGPGSFTAIRVSISVALAIKQALDIPVFTLDTLTAMAMEAFYTEKKVFSIVKFFKNKYFVRDFNNTCSLPQPSSKIKIIEEGAIFDILNDKHIILSNYNMKQEHKEYMENEMPFSFLYVCPRASRVVDFFFQKQQLSVKDSIEPIFLQSTYFEL